MSKGKRRSREQREPDAASAGAQDFFERRGTLIVWAMMALYSAVFITVCLIKYAYFLYTDFDLPICAQATWGILHGQFYNSIRGMYWLGDHSWFTLFLIAPVYAVFRHAVTLLVLQTAVLALGALPVYWLARRELKNAFLAVCFAALYLLYPALGYSNLYQFHPETLATTTLLFAFYYLWVGRFWMTMLFAVLSLMAKENVPLVVAGMGFYSLLLRRPRRWIYAAALVGLSAVFLVVSFGVLKPALNRGEVEYDQMYARWGDTLGEAAGAVLKRPDRAVAELFHTPDNPVDTRVKQQYYVHLLLPVMLLALMSPLTLAIALPVVAQHMLSVRLTEHSIVYHYTKLVTPFVLAASVLGLRNILRLMMRGVPGGLTEKMMHEKTPPRTLACIMATMAVVVAIGCNLLFGPILGSGALQRLTRDESIWPTPHERAMRPYMNAMLAEVPPEGTVVASFQFLPRLANRESVHSWHHILAGHYSVSRKAYDPPTDAVALIANLNDWRAITFVRESGGQLARTFLEANGLAPVEAAGDIVLFKKDVAVPVKLYETGSFAPTRRLRYDYNAQLAFLGMGELSPSVQPGGTLPIQSLWRRTGRADRFYLIQFLVLDEFGRPVFSYHRHICYGLYPVHDWPSGEVVRETYNLVVPTDVRPGRYTVGLRVLEKLGRLVRVAPVEDPELRKRGGLIPLGRVQVLPASR